ncbi:MAG: hypothetical protein Q8L35_09515 [Actinomycetota bacterium]|nr:hypothetical protein [Actinomycetota bacterium]
MLRIKRYIDEILYLDYVILGLKEDIALNGEIEIYKNSAQQTRRANPALTTLIDVIKTYNQLLRQVSELIRSAEIEVEKQW